MDGRKDEIVPVKLRDSADGSLKGGNYEKINTTAYVHCGNSSKIHSAALVKLNDFPELTSDTLKHRWAKSFVHGCTEKRPLENSRRNFRGIVSKCESDADFSQFSEIRNFEKIQIAMLFFLVVKLDVNEESFFDSVNCRVGREPVS